MTKVIAGCPIRNRAWIVERYVAALAAQTRPVDGLLFVSNDCEDSTEDALYTSILRHYPQQCAVSLSSDKPMIVRFDTGYPYWRRGPDGYRRDNCANHARVRNEFVERFLETDGTHLWSVDSDVLPEPDVLEKLLAADKPVIAALVRNGGVWNFMEREMGTRDRFHRYLPQLNRKTPFRVGMTGACCLIRRDVLEMGARYAPHEQGEDCGFAASIVDLYREHPDWRPMYDAMWLHPGARTEHVMEEG